jgi:hypothetical protein
MKCFVTRKGKRESRRFLSEAEIAKLLPKIKPIAQVAATWSELHAHYLSWKGGSDWPWLLDFIRRIANTPNCQCRSDSHAWVMANLPDWGNPFEFTVRWHNSVNVRLKKPVFTVAQSVKEWSVSHGTMGQK